MADMVFRMAGDPPINFKAVDNGDGTYSLAVSGVGGGASYITEVEDSATIALTVEDGVLSANVNAGQFAPTSHASATNNPHSVTKAQVGLGNADNTSDTSKPVSDATQAALNNKADASNTYTKAEVDNLIDGLQQQIDDLAGA